MTSTSTWHVSGNPLLMQMDLLNPNLGQSLIIQCHVSLADGFAILITRKNQDQVQIAFEWNKKRHFLYSLQESYKQGLPDWVSDEFYAAFYFLALIGFDQPIKKIGDTITPLFNNYHSLSFSRLLLLILNSDFWITPTELEDTLKEAEKNFDDQDEFIKNASFATSQLGCFYFYERLIAESCIEAAETLASTVKNFDPSPEFNIYDWLCEQDIAMYHKLHKIPENADLLGLEISLANDSYLRSRDRILVLLTSYQRLKLVNPKSSTLPWNQSVKISAAIRDYVALFLLLKDSENRGAELESLYLDYLISIENSNSGRRYFEAPSALGIKHDLLGTFQEKFNNLPKDASFPPILTLPDEYQGLSEASRNYANTLVKTAIREADDANRLPLIGCFRMDTKSDIGFLGELSNHIFELRLVILKTGIWIAIIFKNPADSNPNSFLLGYWTPHDGDNFHLSMNATLAHTVRVVAAGIWRDATIVKEKTFEFLDKQYDASSPNNLSPNPKKNSKKTDTFYLPRTIYHVKWGSEQDRKKIHEQVSEHRKRPHYRKYHTRSLPPGQKASDDARKLADQYDIYLPDEGSTFVSESLIHEDAKTPNNPDTTPRIVAKGLQMTLFALANFIDNEDH